MPLLKDNYEPEASSRRRGGEAVVNDAGNSNETENFLEHANKIPHIP